MKKSLLSKLCIACLAGQLIFSAAPTSAVSNQIFERSNQEVLSSGATYEHKQIFTKDGWLNLNIVYVNANDPYTSIDTLYNDKGISNRATVSSLTKANNAIAAMNADFFEYSNGYYPLGLTVKNGDVVSTPMLSNSTGSNALPAFYIKDGVPYTGFFKWNLTVGNESITPIKVYYINKGSDAYGGVIMYTSEWKGTTLGNAKFKNLTEVIVEEGKVVDIRYNAPSTILTKGAFELVLKDEVNVLTQRLHIGDEVQTYMTSDPDMANFSTAIGAGSMLLKNGAKTAFNINIKGSQPRSALGITEDKSTVIMLTVDGRDISYKGVSQDTLASIMLSLGAHEAVNFDGGGSTTMVLNSRIMSGPKVVNKPSDGGERRVINAIGVTSTAPKLPASKIELKLESTDLFIHAPNKILIKAFDSLGNPLGVDYSIVKYQVEGIPGTFNGLSFVPTEMGTATLSAIYNGAEASTQIQVIDAIKMIKIDNSEISLNQSEKISLANLFGNIEGFNSNGKSSVISSEFINYTIHGNIGKIEDGHFIASDKAAAGAITLKIGDAVANAKISIGYEKETISGFESLKGMKAEASSKSVTSSISQSKDARQGNYSLLLKYNFNSKEDTRAAYASFGNNPIKIPANTYGIGLWVKGNASSHWLRAKIEDAQGNESTLDFAQNVDWEGWKYIETKLPTSIEYPIRIKNIYLVTTDPTRKDAGEICIDDLKIIRKTPVPNLKLPNATVISDKYFINLKTKSSLPRFAVTQSLNTGDEKLKSEYVKNFNSFFNGYSNIFVPTSSPIENSGINILSGSKVYEYSSCDVIQLDNSKGGIRPTNWNQWPWFINRLEQTTKDNILIILSSTMFDSKGFKDPLEENLLQELLEKKASEGKNIYLVYSGNKATTRLENGVRYIQYPSSSIYEKTDFKNYASLVFEIKDNQVYYGFLPAFANVAYTPSKTSTAPTGSKTSPVRMRVSVESSLNVRDIPNGNVVEKIENGSLVEVIKEPTKSSNGYTWQKIKTISGNVGWVATDYLTVD